ncbi:MAG TPA: SH3 domain-containing protein, partial [Aggregatilineales bacterium]|nr:SH3 domain-containing protein [Aggregatilineales bacterium]
AAPSTRGAVIALLARGTTLALDGRDTSRRWVHGKASTGELGWVSRAYLSLRVGLVVAALPVLNASAPSSGGSSSPSTPPAPAVGGHIGGGFEVGGQVQDLNANTVSAMRRAGMKWVKRQVHMGDGAGGLIGQAHGAGFHILLSAVGDKDSYVNANYQSAFAGYLASLASQGADAIEVGNEMNIDREWKTGSIDPTIYVALLAKAYNAIKGANPNTMVITGALAPTGAEGAFGTARVWNDDRYYVGMARAGAGRYSDCIGVHYNEGIVSPYQTSGDPRGFYPTRYFSTMLSRAIGPFGGKPACFTELGYLTPEGYGSLPGSFAWASNTTVAEQAAWLAGAAVRASRSGQVRLMIVFNVDFTYYGADPQAGYAMIRPGGGCPACDAMGQVVR